MHTYTYIYLHLYYVGLRSRFTEKLEFKSWGVPESVSYILSQLALKKKQPTEEAKAAIVSLVEDYIDSQGEKWGSARDCITVCSKIDDNEELRWRDFTKGYSKRLDNAKKVPGMKFSKEEFEEKESELEKAFYVKAEAEEGTEAEEGEGTASQEAKVTSMVRVIREEDIVKARIIIPISSKDTDVDDSSSAGSGGGNGGGGRAAHAIDIAQVVSDPNPQQKKKQKVKPKDDQNTEKDDKKENNSISLLDAVFAFDKFLDLSSYEGDLPEEVLRLLQIKENEREKRDEAKRQFEELKRKAREESERKKKAREEAEELRKKIEEEKKRLAELAEQV